MKKRTLAFTATVIVGALSLAGCAQSDTAAGGSDAEYGPDVKMPDAKLSLMGFSEPDEIGQTRWDIAQKAIEPASVQSSDGGFDIQAFLSANSANNAPDLIYLKRDEIGALASLGAIDPMNPCFEGEGVDLDQFNAAALAQVAFDGQYYGVPEFNSVQLTMANTDLLDEAGLAIGDVDGSDWDGITAASKDITVEDGAGLSVIGYDPKIPEFFPLWVKSLGAELISEDGKTAQIDTPEALEALEFTMSLLNNEGGWAKVKSFRDSADFFGEGNQFATNALGAMNMENWYVNVLAEMTPDIPIDVVPFISKDSGEPIAMATGSAWAIPSRAEHKAAACKFITTMVETDSWLAAAKVRADMRAEDGGIFTGLLTGNVIADKEIREKFVKPTGYETWDTAIDSIYVANDHLFYMPPNPADAAFRQAWQDSVNRVLAGQMEPKESLAKGQEEAQTALDAAWAKLDG